MCCIVGVIKIKMLEMFFCWGTGTTLWKLQWQITIKPLFFFLATFLFVPRPTQIRWPDDGEKKTKKNTCHLKFIGLQPCPVRCQQGGHFVSFLRGLRLGFRWLRVVPEDEGNFPLTAVSGSVLRQSPVPRSNTLWPPVSLFFKLPLQLFAWARSKLKPVLKIGQHGQRA